MNKEIFEEIEEMDKSIVETKDYSFILDTNVDQNKIDQGFKTLVEGFDNLQYVIPKYQRKYVWSKEQVENLAISLIRGLPIPPIYVYRNEESQLEILDGQQRMLSLFLYYKGKYIKNVTNTQVELQRLMDDKRLENEEITFEELLNDEYPLKDVTYNMSYEENNELKTMKINYNDLPKKVRNVVDYKSISVIEIKVNNEKDKNRVLYKVFENLNSGGTELKNQELRNGVYQCEFYDMLHKLNNSNIKWRNLYGEKHKHSRDVELLLRFSAMKYYFKLIDGEFNIDHYENSYPRLLNDFSDNALKFNPEMIESYRQSIEKFINRIEISDSNYRVQNLMLESLYIASINIDGEYKIDGSFIKELEKTEEYKNYISKSSSSKSRVKGRIDYVYKRLSKYARRSEK